MKENKEKKGKSKRTRGKETTNGTQEKQEKKTTREHYIKLPNTRYQREQ